jgi:hypothetical protein
MRKKGDICQFQFSPAETAAIGSLPAALFYFVRSREVDITDHHDSQTPELSNKDGETQPGSSESNVPFQSIKKLIFERIPVRD